jgi:hypothetical protein
MTEAELARIADEVLAVARAMCIDGPKLSYLEAVEAATRHAMMEYDLRPRHILKLCDRTLRRAAA